MKNVNILLNSGQVAVAKVLIENKAVVDAVDNHKWTPLHVAIHNSAIVKGITNHI